LRQHLYIPGQSGRGFEFYRHPAKRLWLDDQPDVRVIPSRLLLLLRLANNTISTWSSRSTRWWRPKGYEWYEAGPGEWIPSLKSRRLVVDTTPPKGVDNNRWISIDLYNQTLAAYEDGRLVFAAVVGTGSGELYSDPGLYYIYEKRELEQMQGSYTSDRSDFYSLEGVPWTMYYNHAQAIHGIYWPASLGFTQSHGCVNMFPGDAHWLFNWAKLGDWVYVHDPSGQTPMPTPTPMGTPAQEIIYPTPTAQN